MADHVCQLDSYLIVLQCVAVCCSVLQCVAVCCQLDSDLIVFLSIFNSVQVCQRVLVCVCEGGLFEMCLLYTPHIHTPTLTYTNTHTALQHTATYSQRLFEMCLLNSQLYSHCELQCVYLCMCTWVCM